MTNVRRARARCRASAAVPLGTTIILHSPEPLAPPAELEVVDIHPLLQMVANRLTPVQPSIAVRELGPADLTAMKRLVDIAQPGPMLPGAFVLGRFVGIDEGDGLAAIAGDRLRPPGYGELCTVCSHPDFRGRGYARIVVSAIAEAIVARGDTPYLMVVPTNAAAVGLYESLGFAPRRCFISTP
jgi:ribosomal protein S18 acetylase RimI-like enzyme